MCSRAVVRHEGKIPVLIVLIRAHSCAPVKRRAKYAAGSVTAVYFDGRKGNHNLGGTRCRACVHDVCEGGMFVRNMAQARCCSSAVPLLCRGECASSHRDDFSRTQR